jgi:hypothetical protein
MAQISVIMELENATSLRDQQDLTESVDSVVKSLGSLCENRKIEGEIIFSGQQDQCQQIVNKLLSSGNTPVSIALNTFDNSGHGYFSAKMSAVGSTESDFIVFCDSDCVYELAYLTKMYESLQIAPQSVLYGRTFALPARSKFEDYCALAWLFPPESIGYSGSWSKSTWANSMAMHRSTLEKYAFPQIAISRLSGIEIKQERPLWSVHLGSHSIVETEIDAKGYHLQISTWADWFRRQFTHGVGFSIKQPKPISRIQGSMQSKNTARQAHLRNLLQKGQISAQQFRGASNLLRVAYLARAFGYLAVRFLGLKMKVSWPDARTDQST